MRGGLSITVRLSALVIGLLLAMATASVVLQVQASGRQAQELIQRLSMPLARQIVEANAPLLAPDGVNEATVHRLFEKLMAVNPSVEVYLLGPDGRILSHAAPPGHVRRDRVDLQPVRDLLAGAPPPVLGDDPRDPAARQVFSAAPVQVDGVDRGYVYVVLIGEDHAAVSRALEQSRWVRTAWASLAVVVVLGACAGLLALRWVTRPLRELTASVQAFEGGAGGTEPLPVTAPPREGSRDEIARLQLAFGQMTRRLATQWQQLSSQDQQRRELVANISHDLRTPLTSLHGYLETLRLKSHLLSDADRERYLDTALGQSRKVGSLAQSLFELARLEHGGVKLDRASFSLGDLVQDVFQKFELAAEARRQRLVADIAPDLPSVEADLGLMERVLTNLLDNALKHTPEGGRILVQLRRADAAVEVCVCDSGPGIPEALHGSLFTRATWRESWRPGATPSGGLGLLIVRRILQLHGSDIRLDAQAAQGAVFRFRLQAA